MAIKAPIAALCAVAVLAGCGSRANDPTLGLARGLVQGIFTRDAEAAAPTVDLRQVLTRDMINEAGIPLLYAERGTSSATMARSAVNGPNETWQVEGGFSLTLSQEGVLRATRGSGADLMAADIAGTRAVLRGGGSGRAERLYAFVEGDLEQVQMAYSCELARAGSEQINIFGQVRTLTQVVETCSRHPAGDHEIQNRFWIDGSGFAWVSEQWGGPEFGFVRFERLHR